MNSQMTQCIFVGLSTIDVVYGVDEFPSVNTKVAAKSQKVFVGGPATNAAVAFSRLGGKAALVTAVGRNTLANVIREELERYTVQLVDLNPEFEGEPAFRRFPSTAKETAMWSRPTRRGSQVRRAGRPESVRQARVVMVDGHHMQACQAWAERSQRPAASRSCSMAEAGRTEQRNFSKASTRPFAPPIFCLPAAPPKRK